MRIALARWRAETDADGVTTFTPDIDTAELDSWGAIDLRGSGKDYQQSADGLCLVVAPTLDTAIPGALIDLGDDHQTRLGTAVGRALANRLGLNLVEATPGRIAAELLTLHARADDDSKPNPLVGERRFPRSKTDQRRRQRVWCAGVLLYDELGAHVDEEMAYVETWPNSTANIGAATNLDLDWDNAATGSGNSAMMVNSGAAIPTSAFGVHCAHRMATDLGSADHYVEVITSVGFANSHFPGAVVRMTNASLAESYAWGVRENYCGIRKYSAATTFTEIASNSTARSVNVQYTSRIEANGSTLTGSVSGVELVSTTDTAYGASRVGVMAQANGTSGAIAQTRVHRWEADVLGGGGDDETVEPSAITTAVTFPSPTVDIVSDATPTPAVISSAVTFPSPTPSTSESAAPSVISSAVTVPSPSIAATATPAPSAVASTATVPTPDLTGSADVDPSAISTAVALSTPSVDVSADADIAPSAISSAVTFPELDVATSGLATPAAIASTVTVPTPDVKVIMAGTAAPNPIVSSSPMPSGSIHTSATPTPAAISSTVTVPTPTPAQDATATPDPITSSVSVGDPGIGSATVVQPLPIRSDVAVNNPFATPVTGEDEHTQLPWRNRTGGSNRTRTPWTREFRNR